ncbi:unnamed protein product [Coregonus sp. 'balchen']|nr:unnamed protein product [Coregonus sp. 'balchen']
MAFLHNESHSGIRNMMAETMTPSTCTGAFSVNRINQGSYSLCLEYVSLEVSYYTKEIANISPKLLIHKFRPVLIFS